MALLETSRDGNRLDSLKELRDLLARMIEDCDSMRDLASLAKQYRDTIREIDQIEGGEQTDDEIALVLRRRKSAADERDDS